MKTGFLNLWAMSTLSSESTKGRRYATGVSREQKLGGDQKITFNILSLLNSMYKNKYAHTVYKNMHICLIYTCKNSTLFEPNFITFIIHLSPGSIGRFQRASQPEDANQMLTCLASARLQHHMPSDHAFVQIIQTVQATTIHR